MTILLLLCWEFFKIGLFAVGGGLSSIPFLMDLIEKYPDWYTQKELANMVAISESTPGPLGVNMATYVGFTVSGTIGSILASVAYVLPSFIVVLIIARFLGKYKENKNVKWVFSGLHPAVTGLIAAAGFSVIRIALLTGNSFSGFSEIFSFLDWRSLVLFAVILAAVLLPVTKKISPIIYICIGAATGISLGL